MMEPMVLPLKMQQAAMQGALSAAQLMLVTYMRFLQGNTQAMESALKSRGSEDVFRRGMMMFTGSMGKPRR